MKIKKSDAQWAFRDMRLLDGQHILAEVKALAAKNQHADDRPQPCKAGAV